MTTLSTYRPTPGPLHATLLAGTVPLFLGALLSDIAYTQTYQIQWANFAGPSAFMWVTTPVRPAVSLKVRA